MYNETAEQIEEEIQDKKAQFYLQRNRRNLIRKADQILNELEHLNLEGRNRIGRALRRKIQALVHDCEIITKLPWKTENAMNLVYYCQDKLMGNEDNDEDWAEIPENGEEIE